MSYIVKQKVRGKDYYYLRKSIREGEKVKSLSLGYLGKTKKDAEKRAKEIMKKIKNEKSFEKRSKMIEIKKINPVHKKISIEELANFCKRRGFVYASAEIHGGFAGFWDFGHLGVELKKNIKDAWWKYHVQERSDVVGIDGSIITSPKVWKASGHVDSFSDIFVMCKKCKKAGKVDRTEIGKVKCDCGGDYDFEKSKEFKLMFETNVGEKDKAYLRPETAQLIFTNFKFVQDNARMKLPFGIAQIGKAFRNEIAPRDFLFRSREFEQMELQFFVDPDKLDECVFYEKIKNKKIQILTAEAQEKNSSDELLSISEMLEKNIFKNKWHAYWLYNSYQWFLGLGVRQENLRLREHRKDELSHYAKAAVDIEYNFVFGWKEIFGSHDRGQFDLGEHEKFSKKDLRIFDEETKNKILPRVIEASFGVERAFLVFLFDAYFYDDTRENILLKMDLKLAPIKCAIFPIIKQFKFEKIAEKIFLDLKKEFNVVYDKTGSIGKRYARNDEIGTPFCITVDEDSLKNKDVTVRIRDDAKQVRVKIEDLKNSLMKEINEENIFKFKEIINTRKKI